MSFPERDAFHAADLGLENGFTPSLPGVRRSGAIWLRLRLWCAELVKPDVPVRPGSCPCALGLGMATSEYLGCSCLLYCW